MAVSTRRLRLMEEWAPARILCCSAPQSTQLQSFFPFGFRENLLHGVEYRRKGFGTGFLFFFSLLADFPFVVTSQSPVGDMTPSAGMCPPWNAG